jgi:uncharacterized protein
MFSFKHANKSIDLIERYMDKIDQGILIFQEGVKNYLHGNKESFSDNLKTLSTLETDADIIKRKIENILYTQSLMPQLRGDIMRLLEELDNLIDMAKKTFINLM